MNLTDARRLLAALATLTAVLVVPAPAMSLSAAHGGSSTITTSDRGAAAGPARGSKGHATTPKAMRDPVIRCC
jgi:hypothetical protein